MFWLGGDFWVSSSLSSVGDPDLQIRGRGRGGHPDPEIGGGGWAVFKKLGKNFGRKIRWGGGGAGPPAPPPAPPHHNRPSGPSPGSATALPEREQAVWSHCYENDYFSSHANKMKPIFTRKVLHETLFWKWVFGFRKMVYWAPVTWQHMLTPKYLFTKGN